MSEVGAKEITTQKSVIELFKAQLGYDYLGSWQDRANNSNIEATLLKPWLQKQNYSDKVVDETVRQLKSAAALSGSASLYEANQKVYNLLRYGVKIKPELGAQNLTVHLVDWQNPNNNHFALAEEVTIQGLNKKRPDLVFYVNGIALGVLELKRSTVSVTEGIRQNIENQRDEFIPHFFTTLQFIMAGNTTEGLHYATIETPQKYWLRWKEAADQEATLQEVLHSTTIEPDAQANSNPLLNELAQVCNKLRFLELMHDFIVFDASRGKVKKICRHNQYFGVCAAQKYIKRREGGIIWHTQGSGKSLTMVWLAKWIRENIKNSRVLIITDRTELDDQIEKVFHGVNEKIHRTQSGVDLIAALEDSSKWIIGSLIHKFGRMDKSQTAEFIADIKRQASNEAHIKGNLFVFVDECHRTQSGQLHKAMKQLLPDMVAIGFTGTPLLKADKKRSIEIFGSYIHTYKYDEAIADGVVLDLYYEARDIDQHITDQNKVDQWFDNKTKGLTDAAKAQLKKRWGTLQKVLSTRHRLNKIAADIQIDMLRRPRLSSGMGNALLVCDTIYSACRIFKIFQNTDLKGRCAIITSYKPQITDIKGEDSGEGDTEKHVQYDTYRQMLANHFNESPNKAVHKVEKFEKEIKTLFIQHPEQMKLLIVVDKLLTGFDAPPATYLYIDKKMRDHALFQAICRVNRLHGNDKTHGFIVDYKDLFKSLERSVQDYTGEAFEDYDTADIEGLLKNRFEKAKQQLDKAREGINFLCEPVKLPRKSIDYIHFFVSTQSGDEPQINKNKPKRLKLYKLASSYAMAYVQVANEGHEAGYSASDLAKIRHEVKHYNNVCKEVKLASGDYVDLKRYEPGMRQLLDDYVQAEDAKKMSAFDELGLVELIAKKGIGVLDDLPDSVCNNQEVMAESIENNMRRSISERVQTNPKYYEKMSELLDDIILKRKQEALDYQAYLEKIRQLAQQVTKPSGHSYPADIHTPARQALYDNLKAADELKQAWFLQQDASAAAPAAATQKEKFEGSATDSLKQRVVLWDDVVIDLAIQIDVGIRKVKKADWRGHTIKEREVLQAIRAALQDFAAAAPRDFADSKAKPTQGHESSGGSKAKPAPAPVSDTGAASAQDYEGAHDDKVQDDKAQGAREATQSDKGNLDALAQTLFAIVKAQNDD